LLPILKDFWEKVDLFDVILRWAEVHFYYIKLFKNILS
jgi:hypothetical protein